MLLGASVSRSAPGGGLPGSAGGVSPCDMNHVLHEMGGRERRFAPAGQRLTTLLPDVCVFAKGLADHRIETTILRLQPVSPANDRPGATLRSTTKSAAARINRAAVYLRERAGWRATRTAGPPRR